MCQRHKDLPTGPFVPHDVEKPEAAYLLAPRLESPEPGTARRGSARRGGGNARSALRPGSTWMSDSRMVDLVLEPNNSGS